MRELLGDDGHLKSVRMGLKSMGVGKHQQTLPLNPMNLLRLYWGLGLFTFY